MYKETTGLHRLLEPVIEALGYELVGVERLARRRGTLVRVYIDSKSGITVDDCERVSNQISGVLDVEDPVKGHYVLEVSSPGLDRPLFTPMHFKRFAGNTVRIELSQAFGGRSKFIGRLVGVQADDVVINENGKEYRIPFNIIGRTRLVPQMRLR